MTVKNLGILVYSSYTCTFLELHSLLKTLGIKAVNMIEAKPIEINYLLGQEWEPPQINKPKTKYPTFSSIYENKDVKTFGITAVNMIEAKPIEINYFLGQEWEPVQIN